MVPESPTGSKKKTTKKHLNFLQVAKLPCTVVVPRGTPESKCAAIKGYGAELVFCEPTPTGRKETCDRY